MHVVSSMTGRRIVILYPDMCFTQSIKNMTQYYMWHTARADVGMYDIMKRWLDVFNGVPQGCVCWYSRGVNSRVEIREVR